MCAVCQVCGLVGSGEECNLKKLLEGQTLTKGQISVLVNVLNHTLCLND